MEMKKKIIVFAGPSGVGKSTLSNILLHHSDKFEFSVSATTRPMRLGEKHSVHYYFFTHDEFKQKIENQEFLEWEEVYPDRFYGTLFSEISRINASQKVAVLDIDVLGALNIKKQFGDDAYVVFVKPESTEALEDRLKIRGTENEEQIKIRVARFAKELNYEHDFDTILVNATGKIEQAKQQVLNIIDQEFTPQP